jgi:hypothetical protein
MGLPRDDVVFRLWQCDKENHGWREGPPLTVPCQSFDLLGRAFTLATKSASNEKEYYLAPTGARSSIRTLAGLKRLYVNVAAPVSGNGPSTASARTTVRHSADPSRQAVVSFGSPNTHAE